MKIERRIQNMVERFGQVSGWENKYKLVIELGKELPDLDQELKIDKFKVKGCTSQVWLIPSFENGKVKFLADSDSVLVKGIIALLLNIYSDSSPDEIISTKADFLKEIGLMENLTMNRSNGLTSMIKQIQLYAFAYQALAKSEATGKQ